MERTYRFDGRCGLRKQQTKLVLRVLLLLLLQLLLLLLLVLFVCSVRYGSHAKAVNRRHRGTLCSVFVGRAVRVRVARSHAPESRTRRVFSLTARVCRKKKQVQRAPASTCCNSRQSTRGCHRCCICTLPTLRRTTLPAIAAASRWHGLVTRAICHASLPPCRCCCALCVYT